MEKKKHKMYRSHTSGIEDDLIENSQVKPSFSEDVKSSTNREEWMSMGTAFKTQTREQWKLETGSSRQVSKLEEKYKKEQDYKPGSHARELNKYYKDGGSGLPSREVSSSSTYQESRTVSLYDSSWLRKALERAKQQAIEESRSLEDIARDRWGSLEAFYKLLDEAEKGSTSKLEAKIHVGKRESINDLRNSHRSSENTRMTERHRSLVEKSSSKHKRKKKRRHSSSSRSSVSSSNSNDSKFEKKHKRHPQAEVTNRKSLMMKPADESDDELSLTSHQSTSRSFKSITASERSSRPSWRKKKERMSVEKESENCITLESNSNHCGNKLSSQDPSNEILNSNSDKNQVYGGEEKILSDKEMNKLAAKITKAELLGNQELVEKLKAKLEAARNARSRHKDETISDGQENVVILTRTDKTGFTRPVFEAGSNVGGMKEKKNKKSKVNQYDADGKRTSYFADDNRHDLRSMFEKEKGSKVEDELQILRSMATCRMEKLSDDFDVDDLYVNKVCPKESSERDAERDRQRAIFEHEKMQQTLDSCNFCFSNSQMKKHLIVSLGSKCYLCVPPYISMTEGQCYISPLSHISCSIQADEDIWDEIMTLRQSLVRMYNSKGQDCIFFEMASNLGKLPHMVVHCIPMPRETGELAPIYFKKAIMECETEWSVNKKLIELKGRNIRKAVPKGLPYFWVDFGLTPGYAHIIEDERFFPKNFAQEIVCGMLEEDFSRFRKPKFENFDSQRKKTLEFTSKFRAFDPNSRNN